MARFVFMMLDGVGIGALPDAADYRDEGSDTLGNLSRVVDLHLPALEQLGLGNILPINGVPPVSKPRCLVGRLAPSSAGKDTTVGHWEHMGLVTQQPFPTYPEGFPDGVLGPFTERIGRGVLGNKPASGTAIISEFGEQHLATGQPIVYTSADSVFQIAAHIDVVPLQVLYKWCEIARDILQGPHAMARVIARPFEGSPGSFVRTKDRKDFSLAPPAPTYIDLLSDAGVPVLALGKISEIFVGRGIAAKMKVASNAENLSLTLDLLRGTSNQASFSDGLLFTNLVDFDMVWGHRNDADGFATGLRAFDMALPAVLKALSPDDRLIISADHGVDPTTPSTDHSREYVPLLFYPRPVTTPSCVYEGSFADTGASIYQYLTGQQPSLAGRPIMELQPGRGWRRCTPARVPPMSGSPVLQPGRVGPDEARDAAHWLQKHIGEAPRTAVILGSGLDLALRSKGLTSIPYGDIPHWRVGAVPGHAYTLKLTTCERGSLALLRGLIHGYEGFDLSELQLTVRTLAAWGVENLVITTSAGAVSTNLEVDEIVLVTTIVDLWNILSQRSPAQLEATAGSVARTLCGTTYGARSLKCGVHAAVSGPQYETLAEISLLRESGVSTVSMSGTAEVQAAHEEGLRIAMLSVVTNVGATSHDEVAAVGNRENRALTWIVGEILHKWNSEPTA